MVFTRNDGCSFEVSNTRDIIKCLGELSQYYDDVEIDGNNVLVRKGADYLSIGTIQ